eukprot:scpid40453/ scgid1773/ 
MELLAGWAFLGRVGARAEGAAVLKAALIKGAVARIKLAADGGLPGRVDTSSACCARGGMQRPAVGATKKKIVGQVAHLPALGTRGKRLARETFSVQRRVK